MAVIKSLILAALLTLAFGQRFRETGRGRQLRVRQQVVDQPRIAIPNRGRAIAPAQPNFVSPVLEPELRLVPVSSCPEQFGLQLYPHEQYCDQFYKCANGTLTLETCENGLLFDGKGAVHNFCNYNWAVDCGPRDANIAPISSPGCEYAFGIYPVTGGCDTTFLKCAYGEAFEEPCVAGQAYDERIHGCNWPDLLEQCNPDQVVGFSCPTSLPPNSLARRFLPFPRYPTGDCGSFITCVNNWPRLMFCGDGKVFDETTLGCDFPENVPQCSRHFL